MKNYKALNKQVYTLDDYTLVPIRLEDRYNIMQWRNEQIYHLRQTEPLTKKTQNEYFNNVVDKLFDQEQPNQLLFSFLKNGECIGYGGLVHINWIDKNGEISLVLKTEFEKNHFIALWCVYLTLLKRIAFKDLDFHKVFTYAFDIRPKLYEALIASGFVEEARLKEHCKIDGQYRDVVYHYCINPKHHFQIRKANAGDAKLLYHWVNDPEVRQSALNSSLIDWPNHSNWFNKKLNSTDTQIYIAEGFNSHPLGQVRIELKNAAWLIDYSIDKLFRGLGLGKKIIAEMITQNTHKTFVAEVKLENTPSQIIFEKLGFKLEESTQEVKRYRYE